MTQLPLPEMDEHCPLCGRIYGEWIGNHMKARAIAQKQIMKGKHPYAHEQTKTNERTKEGKGVGR